MKNYLDFTLTGRKLFSIWLMFIVFFIVPYIVLLYSVTHSLYGGANSLNNATNIAYPVSTQPAASLPVYFFPCLIGIILLLYFIMFFMTKLMIGGVRYTDKSVVFEGTFGKYIGIILLGLFLTVITLGIYIPWFIRSIVRFYVDHSSLDSQKFKFMGKGSKLFLIFLFTLIIPLILFSVAVILVTQFVDTVESAPKTLFMVMGYLIELILLVPYIYLYYKWFVQVNYKEYAIRWETSFFPSCGRIFFEIFFSFITLGLYFPLALIRLYKYFMGMTVAASGESKRRFGFDCDPFNDYVFILAQIVLTVITLSIYYPWACCKISKRLLSKTYLETN